MMNNITEIKNDELDKFSKIRKQTVVSPYTTIRIGTSIFVECDHSNEKEMHRVRGLVSYHSNAFNDGTRLYTEKVANNDTGETGILVKRKLI